MTVCSSGHVDVSWTVTWSNIKATSLGWIMDVADGNTLSSGVGWVTPVSNGTFGQTLSGSTGRYRVNWNDYLVAFTASLYADKRVVWQQRVVRPSNGWPAC